MFEYIRWSRLKTERAIDCDEKDKNDNIEKLITKSTEMVGYKHDKRHNETKISRLKENAI